MSTFLITLTPKIWHTASIQSTGTAHRHNWSVQQCLPKNLKIFHNNTNRILHFFYTCKRQIYGDYLKLFITSNELRSGIVSLVYSKLTIAHPVGRAAWLLRLRFRTPIRTWMLVQCVCCVWRRYRHLRRADRSFRGILPGVRMFSNSCYYFRYLGLVLGSKPLFTRHLHTVYNKATRLL